MSDGLRILQKDDVSSIMMRAQTWVDTELFSGPGTYAMELIFLWTASVRLFLMAVLIDSSLALRSCPQSRMDYVFSLKAPGGR